MNTIFGEFVCIPCPDEENLNHQAEEDTLQRLKSLVEAAVKNNVLSASVIEPFSLANDKGE